MMDLVETATPVIEDIEDLISSRSSLRIRPLGNTVSLESNLLGVPVGVLHATSAKKNKCLAYSWKTEHGVVEYLFERISEEDSFPIPTHTRFFDILVAFFANNWNRDGMLYFRFSDVLAVLGSKESEGSRRSIYECIRRYQRCNASWKNSWKGRTTTWSSPLIVGSSVFNANGSLTKNPRSNKNNTKWHCIKFCDPIVSALEDKNKRIFFKSIYSCGLSPETYLVYRYFFGFSDHGHVIRPVQQVLSVFPWNSTIKKFLIWISERLSEAKENNFVEDYTITTSFISVKCSNIKEIVEEIVEEIDKEASKTPLLITVGSNNQLKAKKNKSKKTEKVKNSRLTDEDCLVEYMNRKSQGLISEEMQSVISILLSSVNANAANPQKKKMLMQNIRSLLKLT